MQPTTYPNVSDIYATGAPSVVPSASGFTGPDVSNIYAAQNQSGSQPTAQQQPKKEKGNWFTNALPTIGSVAVPTLGALLAPATGGLSLVAAAGLSGLGAAGGKLAENALEGNDATDDLLLSTAEGAAGGAVGGVAGKVLGKGAKMLSGRAKGITDTATKTAAEKAARDAEISAAQAVRNNFGAIKPGVQSANNLKGNQDLMKMWGADHTSPQSMADVSKGGLFINNIDEAAIGTGKPIKTSSLISSKDITTATEQEQQALVRAGIITPEGALPTTVSPIQAHKFAQDLNGEIRTMKGLADNALKNGDVSNYNLANEELKSLTTKYNAVQKLVGTPEVNASIAARTISAEEKADLVKQFGKTQADHIEEAINKATTHQDLVKAKLPYAQMNTLSKQAIADAQASATPRAVARANTDINGDGVADAAAPVLPTASDAFDTTANTPSDPILATVAKALYRSKDNPAILDTLSRIGALGAKIAPATGAAVGASNAQLQSNGDTMGGVMPSVQPTTQTTDQALMASSTAPAGGLTRDDLVTLALYSPSAFSSLVTPSAAQQQTVATANTAEQALSSLGAAPTGGIMSQLAGKLGLGATGEYQRKAAAAAQQVAAALPGTDAGTIEKQLTNYLAGGASIDQAVAELMKNLQATAQNNTNAPYQSLMNFHPSVVSAAGL